ncbi:MAG: PGPGW domain-containing protein [Gammaproteobacteria bacterium]|jgi:hypothetical protein|nr:PGPGW domain-containing protein [Gammaproteobacteria bacterium]
MTETIIHLYTEYARWLQLIAVSSLVMLAISLALLPYLVARLPVDYFCHQPKSQHPITSQQILLRILRNLLGLILLVAGLLMLLLPGQGLLTLVLALLLLDYPQKKKIEQSLLQQNAIFNGLNWLRRKAKVAAFKRP